MRELALYSTGSEEILNSPDAKRLHAQALAIASIAAGRGAPVEVTTTMHYLDGSSPPLFRRSVFVDYSPPEEIPRRRVISPALWASMAAVEPVGDLLVPPPKTEIVRPPPPRPGWLKFARVCLTPGRFEDLAQCYADMLEERRDAEITGVPFSYLPMVGAAVRSGFGVLLDLGKFGVAAWKVVRAIRKFFE